MNCPKCGFQQEEGTECQRCGVVFARFRTVPRPHLPHADHGSGALRTAWNRFRSCYRIFRWIMLAVMITALVLILRTSKPPQVSVPPDAAEEAENKIQQFQSAIRQGAEDKLELTEPELNGWLLDNLALRREGRETIAPQTQESLIALAKTATGGQPLDGMRVEEAQSTIRDVKVELREDMLRLYAIFDMHGVDLSLELIGRLYANEGYIRLEPTGGKLGSLPLTAGTLQAVAKRLFDSPENKEKFRLPPYIQDIAVVNGSLIITSR